jgi:hypothetical protein
MGRRKGDRNRRTVLMERAREAAGEDGQKVIDFLLSVMLDPEEQKTLRLIAARSVAPYLLPRYGIIDWNLNVGVSAEIKEFIESMHGKSHYLPVFPEDDEDDTGDDPEGDDDALDGS